MTPEEILEQFLTTSLISPPKALKAKSDAIKAMYDFARKMCDEQKELCIEDWNDTEEGDVLRDYSAIKNAPYPKELQQ